ncbi:MULTISPECIES: hypothetical protein [unclassified Methylobacterium]|uniref:hypothetical protein n=1 Tax=unclassified Methylobacterium TaxID=2615210 RepID=UPI0006F20E11|nr:MULTISPECIES: hypothetical protein [unclassified Methylobacterium]KQO66744.1 hypothetical protein ASF18_08345 [Methylobacterium sp. Leaf89]KQO77809.1 hypothetical protein ASF20_12555 [Methylobacterium sp. Leaf88]
MNLKAVLLLVGLVVGGLAGYLTRPEAAEIKIGSFSLEVQGDSPAGTRGGSLTTGQMQHIGIFAVIGAVLGLGIGFVADRRRA